MAAIPPLSLRVRSGPLPKHILSRLNPTSEQSRRPFITSFRLGALPASQARPKPRLTSSGGSVDPLTSKGYGQHIWERVMTLNKAPLVFAESPAVQGFNKKHGLDTWRWQKWFLESPASNMQGYRTGRGRSLSTKQAAASRSEKGQGYSTSHIDSLREQGRQRGEFNDPRIPILESDEYFGEALYVYGETALKDPEFKRLGIYMLSTAVEVDHVSAAVKLVELERARQIEAPYRAKQLVREAAEAGSNWRAMTLHALNLSNTNRSHAYELAKLAFQSTRPSKEVDEARYAVRMSPWLTLYRFATDAFARNQLQEDGQLQLEAARAGVYDYNDPEACWWYAFSPAVVIYSDEWFDLMSKAAMAGQPAFDPTLPPSDTQRTAADLLAKYYLEKYCWYPCEGKPSKHHMARLGFDWLEAAAHVHAGQPSQMVTAYLKMAMILRDNDRMDEGLQTLHRCVECLEELPAAEKNRNAAQESLQMFIERWQSGNFKADTSPLFLFGPPSMDPAQKVR